MAQTNLGALFKLFSLAFEPPTPMLVDAIVSGALQNEMKDNWTSLDLPAKPIDALTDALKSYCGRDNEEVLHEIRREFTRLFLGDKPLVTNTEGLWRLRSCGRDGTLIVNSYALEVADFMRSCGVVKAEGYNDCVDYIETECDFAAFLARDPEYLHDLGKDPVELLESFIENHMAQWIPGFCFDVIHTTCVVYYEAISTLMSEFMKEV